MLLRFGVANHLSIRDYQELYLSASKRIKRKGLVIPVPTLKEDAVPLVAVYGANAAGKSNLIDAMDEIQRAVVRSHKSLGATDRIPRTPFRLDDVSVAKPTRFDCTFTVGKPSTNLSDPRTSDTVYEYGFEYTEAEFLHEWLYRIVRRERQSTQVLFERKTEEGEVRVTFGSQLRGENRTIANLTRGNSLFLSAAAQNNHPQLTELYRYFAEQWEVILSAGAMEDNVLAERLSEFEHMKRLLLLVRQADVGIGEIGVEDEEVEEERLGLARDIAGLMVKHMRRHGDSSSPSESEVLDALSNRKRLRFGHSAVGGGTVGLRYPMESKGTRTLISLLIPALEALARGTLLVIDELDTSLHPDMARAFVSLFSKEASNPNGAQLVFSTHDVALLGSDQIHQDEIWMTDKSHEGVSRFTPLTEFRLRSRDDIEKAYRHGRLGGVPISNSFFVDFDSNEISTGS